VSSKLLDVPGPASDDRFQLLVDAIEDYAIYMLDDTGRVATWNRGAQKNKGYTEDEIVGQHYRRFFSPDDVAAGVPEAKLAEAANHGRCAGEGWRIRKDGDRFWASYVLTAMRDESGRLTGFAKVTRDLSERKQREDDQLKQQEQLAAAYRELELLAMTDSLTGLANRRAFEPRAGVEFSIATRKHRPLSILVMDIDGLKRCNDVYGHAAGDEALKVLGTVLKTCVRTGDIAARLGGDEFGCLLPETDEDGAQEVAERIQAMFRTMPHGPAELTVSMGISTMDDTTHNWEQLLARADEAMYEAKRTGKNRTALQTTDLPKS